ncbi:unnamed protein product, partial [Effrenium voratum]
MVSWLENTALICWILKDASWVMLFPYTAFPAVVGALILESFYVAVSWQRLNWYHCASCLVPVLWITGNGCWMFRELLTYETPSRYLQLPWFQKPLVGGEDPGMQTCAGVFFICTMVVYVFAQCGRFSLEPTAVRRLDADAWTGFWTLKDFLWLLGYFWPALACSVVVSVLMLREEQLKPHAARGSSFFVAELLWLLANTVWVSGELQLGDFVIYRA